ncbi:MAG TPA: class I SAM-dependent methyltransferase [Candidatus Limnocylindria bacterium]|nr:class I SAM-dependent methyltransferase [Candidatus Limnocylindria bacterium]
MTRATKRIAVDDVAAHNQKMWDRLAVAGIPYTRPQGTPPRTMAGKRAFLDPNGRLAGLPIKGQRVLALAGGGGWHPVLFAELGAETTVLDISARQLKTVRDLSRSRGVTLRLLQGDMRDLSAFKDGAFDLVWHSHSIVFVPDAARVIAEVGRVLAPGGVYRASTMHPVTLRMYGTWTGTGWGFLQSYFADGAVPFVDPTWEFEDVTVDAPTLEYGHRISDLINACAAAGLMIDGFWETTPGEISTKVPLRALPPTTLLAEREDVEPGSDDALERYLPAFIEWRARKVSPPSGFGSRARTATRSPKASASRRAGSPTSRRRPPSR